MANHRGAKTTKKTKDMLLPMWRMITDEATMHVLPDRNRRVAHEHLINKHNTANNVISSTVYLHMSECLRRFGNDAPLEVDVRMSVKLVAPQIEFHKDIRGILGCGRVFSGLHIQDLGMTLDVQNVCGAYIMTNLGMGESVRHIDDSQEHQDIISLSYYMLQ